ncbi:hypothetical protein FF38_01375 [Lucilia cuprina]|uniref:Uncharacterized protein n=1 Tax=Lucilia cuprina TaxID=7375 RepID=A0A0L0C2V3_LUCCU|nr:hypothetical protein FF38_01375 [Lucilia cuprina]
MANPFSTCFCGLGIFSLPGNRTVFLGVVRGVCVEFFGVRGVRGVFTLLTTALPPEERTGVVHVRVALLFGVVGFNSSLISFELSLRTLFSVEFKNQVAILSHSDLNSESINNPSIFSISVLFFLAGVATLTEPSSTFDLRAMFSSFSCSHSSRTLIKVVSLLSSSS